MKFRSTGIPDLAVRRPLLIGVFNLLIVIAGIAAMFGIEVRELPDVDRPTVTVRANLPGAAPETMDAEVTRILEGAVARVSGVREIRASSEENNTRIVVQFNPGVDLDTAASDTREAISQVTRELPDRVENVFVTKSDSDARPIISLAIISDTLSEDEVTRIINTDIAPELLSIDGVASLQEFGTRQRQMRVVVDPPRLNRFGLTIGDLADALRQAPFDIPAGSFRSVDQELIVRANATAATPDLIKDIEIADGITVGDVADVIVAPADADNLLRLNGEPVIGLGVVRQAQSNTIFISNAVEERVARLNADLDEIEVQVLSDEAVFIRVSVLEVITTLAFTVGIVVLTIWLFLGSWKATLIPALTIPIALVGTLAGIWALGFSINLLTLLGLVLATGLIVDDAIVVLENVQRQQREGIKRHAAAAVGTRQVFFAVVATTAVLVAVFVPIAFQPSTTGRLFREFAFVLSFAVLISSFVALTLTPAIASKLTFDTKDRSSIPARIGKRLNTWYDNGLKSGLKHPLIVVATCLGAAAFAGFLFTTLPSELVPQEDRGEIEVFATGPDGVGLSYMERQADAIEERLQPYVDDGVIQSVFTVVGRYDPNRVGVTARMAPWDEREISQQALIEELQAPMSDIPGARVSVFGRGSLDIGWGNRGGLEAALTGGDYNSIYLAARALSDAIDTGSDILSNPDISYQPTQPQISVEVDRRRATDLGVSLDELSLTLRAMVGGEELVDLNVNDEAVPIVLEAQTQAIESPADLRNLFVRSDTGALVPVSSLTRVVEEGVAAELDRVEQRRAIEIETDIAPGVALADAVEEMRRLAAETLPDSVRISMQGEAETLRESSNELLITYSFALVIVLLALIGQFESLTSPFVVLLTVPFGLAAAVFALYLSGTSLNIYSQIGLVLLIGLMAKNGILLVEFADQLRATGRKPMQAVREAAAIRTRPIVMTVVSTALGALPLILSGGAGAEARSSIGWVVFGGLGIAALFTLFLTPVIYLGLASLTRNRARAGEALDNELEEARALDEAETTSAAKT